MPWIFLCLILANIAYFGWELMEGTQPQAKADANIAAADQVGEKILLLSEKPELLPKSVPVNAPSQESSLKTDAPDQLECFKVGPFASDAKLQEMLGLMRGMQFLGRTSERKVDVKDYWVFVPVYASRDRAERKLRDLKSRGIEGFVVKDGTINVISLNHFSREDQAQAFRQKLRAIGVNTEYRETKQYSVEYWAYLAPDHAGTDLRAAIDAQLTKEEGLRRESVPCEE